MDDVRNEVARHKLDVDDYYRMAEAGILNEDSRVELIDGEIIDMAPIGTKHGSTVNRLNKLLVMACGDLAIVSVQNPVRLDELNEPQPDVAALRPKADWYGGSAPPAPADVYLLVEVSDSTIRFDRAVKLPLYARFGIPELWIVDLKLRVLEAHRDPAGDGYATKKTYRAGERIALAMMPEIGVVLAGLFG